MRFFRLIGFALLFLMAGTLFAADVTVNCAGGPGDFPSVNAALAALDLVGPNSIKIVAGPCIESVVISERQRLYIFTQGGMQYIMSRDSNPAMSIDRSSVVLDQIGFSDSGLGLLVNEASEVNAFGLTVENNSRVGVAMLNRSILHFSGTVQNNGRAGITSQDSLLTIDGNTQVLNNGRAGVSLIASSGQMDATAGPNVIAGNRQGVNVLSGSQWIMYGGNTIQNNKDSGINVQNSYLQMDGADTPNIIEGHPFVGINTFGAHVLISGPNIIRNNGFSMVDYHAGIRADDSTLLGIGGPDVSITGNTGPGIEATMGSSIDLTAATISGNSEDGIRLLANSRLGVFGVNTSMISGNGGSSVVCDKLSLFWGDATGISGIKCENVGKDGRASRNVHGPKKFD